MLNEVLGLPVAVVVVKEEGLEELSIVTDGEPLIVIVIVCDTVALVVALVVEIAVGNALGVAVELRDAEEVVDTLVVSVTDVVPEEVAVILDVGVEDGLANLEIGLPPV